MTMLHGDTDRRRNADGIRRAWIGLGALTAVWAVLVIASLIWRDASYMHNVNEQTSQIVTIGVTLLWGALGIFFWSMKLTPLLCYRKYLKEITSGLSRDVTGVVVRFDDTTTFRDGLSFYALVVDIGDTGDPEDERLLYWDAQLARPDIRPGERVSVTAHGNDMIGLTTL